MKKLEYRVLYVEKQKNDYYLTRGYIMADGHYFPCVSGKYGRGTIPLGEYEIKPVIELKDDGKSLAYKRDGKPWYAPLIPIGKCEDSKGDRTGLAIHPDGNIEGTLGCIGITDNDDMLFDIMRRTKFEKLIVI